MTYCLGILTKEGVIGLADTRITSGTETTVAKKIFTVQRTKHSFFIMTSGLRSVRDKTVTYLKEEIDSNDSEFKKLFEVTNSFGRLVRRVGEEDKKPLEEAGLHFNLYAIVGGQLEEDDEPKLFLMYPQGNWIEIGKGTPYVIIGNTGFGTPVLKRSLTYDSTMEFALRSGFLSFDATKISANDVDYPIDIVVLRKNEYNLTETRFEEKELGQLSEYWNSRLKQGIDNLPAEALSRALLK